MSDYERKCEFDRRLDFILSVLLGDAENFVCKTKGVNADEIHDSVFEDLEAAVQSADLAYEVIRGTVIQSFRRRSSDERE